MDNKYIGIKSIPIGLEPDEKVINEKYPNYTIYINKYNLVILPEMASIDTSDPKWYMKNHLVSDFYIRVCGDITLSETNENLKNIRVLIEGNKRMEVFFLKLVLEREQFIAYVNYLNEQKGLDALTNFNYPLSSPVVIDFGDIHFDRNKSPHGLLFTDPATLIKYSNLLIDDFISSNGIKEKSKYYNRIN